MKADLHSHTIHSDGILTVLELIQEAEKKGLSFLAITDHDCFEGAEESLLIKKQLKIIYGAEISTTRNDESVHILAYYKDLCQSNGVHECLQKLRIDRLARANKILDLLKEHFNIELKRTFLTNLHSITRGTLANEITKQGYNYSHNEIFKKMIGEGCPAYLPVSKLQTQYVINLIHQSGGLAVLAHPCLLKKNNVEEIIKLGLDGLEGIYPSKYNDEVFYRRLAKKYNLLITGGSDFHRYCDSSHGEVGQCYIEGQDLEKFLEVLQYEY